MDLLHACDADILALDSLGRCSSTPPPGLSPQSVMHVAMLGLSLRWTAWAGAPQTPPPPGLSPQLAVHVAMLNHFGANIYNDTNNLLDRRIPFPSPSASPEHGVGTITRCVCGWVGGGDLQEVAVKEQFSMRI